MRESELPGRHRLGAGPVEDAERAANWMVGDSPRSTYTKMMFASASATRTEFGDMDLAPSLPSDAAEIQQIIATARSSPLPQGWFVWTLRRDQVRRAALGWALTAVFGFAVLVPILLTTVPGNFQSSAGLAAFTVILLVILGLVAFGGLSLMITDIMRLVRADQYLLIMTPTDYLKVEPGRVTHVPMGAVAYVTLKGVKVPNAAAADAARPNIPSAMGRLSPFGGGFGYRRELRRPASLAFLDTRTNREVVVGTDDAFDALPVLEEILDMYAGGGAPASQRGR
jgi:hypothetical protein